MLKGDLSATPLSDVLSTLAGQSATGCLHIDDGSGDEALVYFKNGKVYSAYVPGRRPQLGARLISSGTLAPEALAEALEAQENELQGWRLGELLIHLGYVERAVVEAFVLEQLREAAYDLSRWQSGRYRFRKNEKTREDVGSHAHAADLLAEVERRHTEWDSISGVVHGPNAVPVLSAGGLASAEMTLDQDEWALLCKVDGARTVAQLARDCGFTTFEAGQIVFALVNAGLLQVEETVEVEEPEAEPEVDAELAPLGAALASVFADAAGAGSTEAEDDAWVAASELSRLLDPPADETAAAEPEPVAEQAPAPPPELHQELASLTAALADLPPMPTLDAAYPAPVAPVAPRTLAPRTLAPRTDGDPFSDSLARVSEALNALLGEALPTVPMPEPPPVPELTAAQLAAARGEAERVERMRAAAAAELAEAHAMAEAARQAHLSDLDGRAEAGAPWPAGDETSPGDAARQAEEERIQAERRAAEDAARRDAERRAAEEAARLAAEQLAAEEQARREAARKAEEEAARIERDRLDAERRAAEEAARLEAERVAAEEAARLAAERAEAERLAAEEAARLEAERLAAQEAARIEAERAEAERLAAERAEAERLAAERAEAERRAAEEAVRLEAERRAADEAARVAAERRAAEEAARAEAAAAVREEAERRAAERHDADVRDAEGREAERAAVEAARLEVERLAADEAAREEELQRNRYAVAAAEAQAAEIARLIPDPAPIPGLAPAMTPRPEVAAAFRDLAAAADTVETLEEFAPAAPDPAPNRAPVNGSQRHGLSETAALMRELTSLGLDDEPASPAAGAAGAATRSAQPKEQPKKRKGLFGR